MKEAILCYLFFSLNRLRSIVSDILQLNVISFLVFLVFMFGAQDCDASSRCTTWAFLVGVDFSFWLTLTGTFSVICFFIGHLLPTNKEASLMVTTYLAVKSEEAKKIPDNVLKKINDYLGDKK